MLTVRCSDLVEAALAAGGKEPAFIDGSAAVRNGPGYCVSGGGIVVGIQAGGGELNCGAGEQHGVGGGHIVAVQLTSGLKGGGQEDGGAVGALRAIGGAVDHLHSIGVRIGSADGGRAAAVHGDGLNTTQFHQALSRLGQGAAHAVTGLLAVQSVENHGAVGLDAHCSPGGAFRGQAG